MVKYSAYLRKPKSQKSKKRRSTYNNKVSTIVNLPGNRGNVAFRNPARLKYVNLGYLLPTKLKIRLPYFDYQNVNTSAGTNYAEFILRANSIFDPMYSGLARNVQTPLHDCLIQFYNSYKVTKAFVNVNFRSSSATSQGKVCIHANTTTTADTATYSDAPYQLFSQVNTKVAYWNSSTSGDPPTQLLMSRTTNSMFPFYGPDASASSSVGLNPTASWFYHITVWDQNNDTASGTVVGAIDVKLVQDVIFGDLAENTST